jgi:hypothetical protein
MMESLLDLALLILWGAIGAYFLHRFLSVTRVLVSLSLALMAFGCAALGIADRLAGHPLGLLGVKLALLATAGLVGGSILHVTYIQRER